MSFAHSIINNPKSWGRKAPHAQLPLYPVSASAPLPAVLSIDVRWGITTYTFDGGFVAHYNAAPDTVEVIDTVSVFVTTYPMAFLCAHPGNAPLDIMERIARRVAEDVVAVNTPTVAIP